MNKTKKSFVLVLVWIVITLFIITVQSCSTSTEITNDEYYGNEYGTGIIDTTQHQKDIDSLYIEYGGGFGETIIVIDTSVHKKVMSEADSIIQDLLKKISADTTYNK